MVSVRTHVASKANNTANLFLLARVHLISLKAKNKKPISKRTKKEMIITSMLFNQKVKCLTVLLV